MPTVTHTLMSLRDSLGYSREYVAAELGTSTQTIKNWEMRLSQMSFENAIKLAECYDISLDYLRKIYFSK